MKHSSIVPFDPIQGTFLVVMLPWAMLVNALVNRLFPSRLNNFKALKSEGCGCSLTGETYRTARILAGISGSCPDIAGSSRIYPGLGRVLPDISGYWPDIAVANRITIGDTIQVVKIDTEKYPEIANKYNIEALPTFILFNDGKPFDRFEGALTANQLIQRIEGTPKVEN
ncbi:Thioredoxin [Artemisia annua]|uniref:Thioredoxin n=1 Tax=Artemisia annua TaxID=35608 RepID=A0A2U1QGR4_ARTAN|nr:Thioredoxin [Artemisia annua]